MNKLNLKKLLTLLVCLTLIVSVVLLAACNKKTDDNKTPDNTSASPSFTNGNFRSYTTSDKGYPYAPSSFTGSPTSDTEGSTLPKLETVKRGVINLADYQNLGAWCTFSKFDAKRLTDEEDAKNYNKDDNVLMINNTEARYYMYRSSEFSVAANTKYLLQVDVRTANLNGGEKKGATIKIAKSYSSGSSIPATEGYASFDAITVGEWTTYSFIIDGKYNGSTSLELQLMLGNNNLRDEYKTSGYAFFDNIRLTTVKDDTVLPTENVKTITLSVPNGSFDYKTTSDYPYLYNRVTTTDTNSNYGLVNEVDAKDGKITLVNEYAVDAAAVEGHGSVFAIYNVADARMGFYTTNPLYFKRGGYYKVTVSLNTKYVENGKAYLALGKSKDLSDNTVIEIAQKDSENNGWNEYTFYVYANENTADELYFHFGLGKDSDDKNKAKGYILVDDLKIEETDDISQTGDNVTNSRFKPEDNKLTDAFVNKSGTDINGVPVTITGDGEEFSADDKTPYVSSIFSARNRKFTSAKATLAKFQTKATLQKDTFYRFSVWVRTVDVPSTSGVVLTVYDGDKDVNSAVKAIATFAAVTTDKDLADSSSSLNGYRELVCYFHTASLQNQDVTFEISLGSGGAFTSSTLFSGTAYIANASLVETDYTKYNGASASGTYEKKYDWYETLSSETFTNGQFQKYNYSDTKFFKDGGVNEKGEFQSTSFGVPSGWTLKGEKDKAVAGIVDVNRENLLNNLATKLGITAEVLKAVPVKCDADDVETFGIYAGGDSYLLINSADVEGLAKESVRVGYVSNSFTLNANSYYKISVMVKVMGDSKASVYLMTDNNIAETNVDSKFENIGASTASQTGGWKRYTFYVKTGFSSISATLGLYLGGEDKDVALTDANMVLADGLNGKYVKKAANEYEVYNKNTHKDATETYNYKDSAKGGTVLFDYVIKEDISESVYNAKTASATASAANEYEETKRVEMNLDSFGLATTPDENKPTSPKGWTKTSLTKDTDTEQLQSGVIYSTEDKYKAHSGESCLIIPYLNTAGASYYASDAKTLTKDGFYKISVWAKLSEGHTGKAYITLVATNYGENSKYVDYASQTIEVNSTDWKEYVFFIKAPSSDTKIDKYGDNAKDLSLKIRLGFGESADNKASGYVLFDDVLIEKLDVKADEFDKHVNDFKAANADLTVNTVKYSAIDKEEETTPDKEPDKEDSKDSGKNFNWVIFTSVAFGAIVVIAVAAFFLKKYLPKHKEGKQQVDKKKTSKKKEDDYKNLND